MTGSTDHPTKHRPWILRTLVVMFSLALGSSALVAAQSPATTTTPSTTLPLYEAYLKASNTDAGDGFGLSIAVDGDTIVVGAPFEDSAATGINGNQGDNSATNAGAAYVFVRSGTTWTQQAYLKASNTDAGDEFGYAVTLTGDTLVISAPFEDSAATGINGDQTNNNVLDSGAAYVFVRSGSTWTQQTYLKASNTEERDFFGASLASDIDRILIGAPYEDSNAASINGDQYNNDLPDAGAAYLYERVNHVWAQAAYLKAPHYSLGGSFGAAVAMEAHIIVVGVPFANTAGPQRSGLITIFIDSGTSWSLAQLINNYPWDADDRFGQAIDIKNQRIVVSANGEDSNATLINGDMNNNAALSSGAVYIYDKMASSLSHPWQKTTYIKASNTQASDNFGNDVAFCGTTVLSSAPSEASAAQGIDGNQADNSAKTSGAVYRYIWDGAQWHYRHYLKASNTNQNDYFGTAIACDDQLLAVGAPYEDSASQGINGNQTDNSALDAGAVYVLSLPMQGYTHLPAVTGEEITSPYPLPQR